MIIASTILELQLGTFSIKASMKLTTVSIPFAPRLFILSIASTNVLTPKPKAATLTPNISIAVAKTSIPLSSLSADKTAPNADNTTTVNNIAPIERIIFSGSTLESFLTATENNKIPVIAVAILIPKFRILSDETTFESNIKLANKPPIKPIADTDTNTFSGLSKESMPIAMPILRIVLPRTLTKASIIARPFTSIFFDLETIYIRAPSKKVIPPII